MPATRRPLRPRATLRPVDAPRPTLLAATLWSLFGLTGPAHAELPVPCAPACTVGAQSFAWRAAGSTSEYLVNGPNAVVKQALQNETFNWSQFNIGAGNSVEFQQPSSSSVALNRIFQADPSRIQGALRANGQVYLINQNGIVFGPGAKVDVNTLLASTIDLNPAIANLFEQIGLTNAVQQTRLPPLKNSTGQAPGRVEVQGGARITAQENGRVILIGGEVTNSGTLEASGPGGQVILAAAQDEVFLFFPDDPDLRGLGVELGEGGTIENLGNILARKGAITLAGLTVNQRGVVRATTAVDVNGSIRLQARDRVSQVLPVDGRQVPQASRAGTVRLGAGSTTEVVPDPADTGTAIDDQQTRSSLVAIDGREVEVQSGATVRATGGRIRIDADDAPSALGAATAGTLHIGSGATLDASGVARVKVPMARNVATVEVRGSELAGSPAQRDGVLFGRKVSFDVRKPLPRIANLKAGVDNLQRSGAERATPGGSIVLKAFDSVRVDGGATLNVSGGAVEYDAGFLDTTRLVFQGRIVDISEADPLVRYDGIVDTLEYTHAKWGAQATQRFNPFGVGMRGSLREFVPGYVEGKDAGSIQIEALHASVAGQLLAHTTVGLNQYEVPGATDGFARPWDELPRGGRVVYSALGDSLVISGGLPFTARGIQSYDFDVAAFALLSGANLDLGSGGRLDVDATGAVSIDGTIRARAGSVSLSAGAGFTDGSGVLTLTGAARIDTSGGWVRDEPQTPVPAARAPRWIAGGSIELDSHGDLLLATGSGLDVTAGALADVEGNITPGAGGSITLAASADRQIAARSPAVRIGSTLKAHTFQDATVSTLRARLPEIRLGGSADGELGSWQVPLALFADAGFGAVELASNERGLEVARGTTLNFDARNLVRTQGGSRPSSNGGSLPPTGTPLASFTRPELLHPAYRQATRLSFSVDPFQANQSLAAGNDDLLRIGAGALLAVSPGGTIELHGDAPIVIEGTLRAPGGRIAAELAINTEFGYDRGRGIWLSPTAQLDASAVAVALPADDAGRITQLERHAGGTVSLRAGEGYVMGLAGSRIDVAGVDAALDVAVRNGVAGTRYERATVALPAGRIDIASSNGFALFSTLAGSANTAQGASGGTLALTLDGELRRSNLAVFNAGGTVFPEQALRLQIAASPRDFGVTAPSAIADGFVGIGRFDANAFTQGGFASLEVAARPSQAQRGPNIGVDPLMEARVELVGNVQLQIPERLIIDAPILQSDGGRATLAARYVALGFQHEEFVTSDTPLPGTDEPLVKHFSPTAGTGGLRIDAGFIDVVGFTALRGFGGDPVVLDSASDIRLRGVRAPSAISRQVEGTLAIASDLVLAARRVYTSTLSEFSILNDAADGLVRFTGGGDETLPLSAGGKLTVVSDRIEQLGTLMVPFGELTLDAATSLVLGPNSLTSVTGNGQTVLFGETQIGEWVFAFPSVERPTRIFDAAPKLDVSETLPQKRIRLLADGLRGGQAAGRVSLARGARIDTRSGGSLLATEFLPGPRGAVDLLGDATTAGSFALLPALGEEIAPYDPLYSSAFDFGIGTRVTLANTGFSGLAAGTYAVLPARYALLPGAVLMTPLAAGDTALANNDRPLRTADGLPVVTASLQRDARGVPQLTEQRYKVEDRAALDLRAEYRVTDANDFFAAQAAAKGVAAPLLPRDAGALSLNANAALSLGASIVRDTGSGRGARVDIGAERISIVQRATGAVGSVELVAADLMSLGADSLLIGGARSVAGSTTSIDHVDARELRVTAGTALEVPELMLVASDTLEVGAGASLRASGGTRGTARGTLALAGDNALLVASSDVLPVVARSAIGANPDALLAIDGSASLFGAGSLVLDSTGIGSIDGQLGVGSGGGLRLGADRIGLGQVAPGFNGLALDAARVQGLGVSALEIASGSAIALFGSFDLSLDSILIDAPGLVAATDGASVGLLADRLRLQNTQGRASTPATANGAALRLGGRARGLELTLGTATGADTAGVDGGDFDIDGYAQIAFDAASIIGVGTHVLDVDATATTLASGVIGSLSGQSLTIDGSGSLNSLARPGVDLAAIAPTLLGGSVSLRGSTLAHAGLVYAPGGSIELTSTAGNLSITGVVDAAGLSDLDFRLTTLGTPGGRVTLRANGGNLDVGSAARVDVSGGRGGRAGSGGDLRLEAIGGALIVADATRLQGTADSRVSGARLFADATQFGSNLTFGASDFSELKSFRLRGPGDLEVGQGQRLAARTLALSADQGAVIVRGTLDASGDYAGRIDLAARDRISVEAGASLLAFATGGFRAPTGAGVDDGHAGGIVTLFAGSGALDLAGGLIDVHGTTADVNGVLGTQDSGRVQLMARRGTAAGIDSGPVNTAIAGARQIEVFGHQRYTTADVGNVLGEATGFSAQAANVLAALGLNGNAVARVAPSIEIVANGDLDFSSLGLNLAGLFNAAALRPGLLSVRATGTLTLDTDIVDGTINDRFNRRIADSDFSWSYAFTGGADPDAADLAAVTAGTGGLALGPNTDVVTGTGDIRLASGGNLDFGTNATVQAIGRHLGANFRGTISDAFTGPNDNIQQTAVRRFLQGVSFPEAAGDIRLSAAGNLQATRPTQQISQWTFRLGGSGIGGDVGNAPDAWGVVLGSYAGNVGMFGGGTVSVDAGGDVVGMQVSNVSVGRQEGVNSYNRASRAWSVTSNVVDELGGGQVDILAGGNVAGLDLHVTRGDARVKAGQGIVGHDTGANVQNARLFLGDARVMLEAAGDIDVGTVLDANTVLLAGSPTANPQPVGARFETFYFTYTANAALDVLSTAGDILFGNEAAGTSGVAIAADPLVNLYPGDLGAYAASGRIGIAQRMNLFPTARGTLELVAARDIGLSAAGAAVGQIVQMDSDPALLPTLGKGFAHPTSAGAQNADTQSLLERFELERDDNGRLLVDHAATPLHAGDRRSNLLIARDGDIAELDLTLAKAATLSAGTDIAQIIATVQNVNASDISLFLSGRDFVMSAPRLPGLGRITTTSGIGVDVAGPGGAQFIAGRDINLGTSVGLRSIGDFANPGLADQGASLTLLAGIGNEPAWSAFADRYFNAYASQISLTDGNGLALPTTRANFAQVSLANQRAILLGLLFEELAASGVAAADPLGARFQDYGAGFKAIQSLFPGAYRGNITTALSTVQTQDGGSINLIVPGGLIDAGLTSTAGLAGEGDFKDAIDLGYIVFRTGSINAFVRDNFNVNSTRVFAQQGGDILIWSSEGDIDAGRGAKSAASIPLIDPVFDEFGNFVAEPPLAVSGSGIRNFAPPGVEPGTLFLFAPKGVINAGDAGIGSAGNIVLGATDVIGADNIDIGGVAVGVPTTDTGSIAAGLSGVGDVAASATKATEKATAAAAAADAAAAASASEDTGVSIISVKVLGFGA